MTIPLSPDQRYTLWLKSDDELPEDRRPVFVFKHLSGREQIDVAELFEELKVSETTPDAMRKVFELLRALMVDWENVRRPGPDGGEAEAIPFDLSRVEDILQQREARELVDRAWLFSLTGEDLGFAGSQSSTDTDESAAPEADAESV